MVAIRGGVGAGRLGLRAADDAISKTLERLASARRINQASDDAAGLAISERLSAQLRSLGQAERNSLDGISAIDTADGGASQVSGLMTRMRELSLQAANGTLGSQERQFLQQEVAQLRDEIDRVAATTEFNGEVLLDGGSATLQVGADADADSRVTLSLGDLRAPSLGGATLANGLADVDISTPEGARAALSALDEGLDVVSSVRADLGAMRSRIEGVVSQLGEERVQVATAESRIRDADMAVEASDHAANLVRVQVGIAVEAHANQVSGVALAVLG